MDKETLKRVLHGHTGRIAKALGLNRGCCHHWMKAGRIPAERVLVVEEITGVPRYELRPDIYPREKGAPKKGRAQ
jgi:DNA-binding transcriptional regulator YdaS (Cro superfamily)